MLVAIAFFSNLIADVLSFHQRGLAAVLTAVVFAVLFVVWTYYPHDFPLPTRPRPV